MQKEMELLQSVERRKKSANFQVILHVSESNYIPFKHRKKAQFF